MNSPLFHDEPEPYTRDLDEGEWTPVPDRWTATVIVCALLALAGLVRVAVMLAHHWGWM